MKYEIKTDKANKTVLVRIYGPAAPEDHISARKEASALLVKNNYSRLLVELKDLKTDNIASLTGCFDFGTTFVKVGNPIQTRIANIIPEEGKSRDDINFVSTVAANRGIMIKNFHDSEKAMEWLLS